jgi:hypothetical protein
MRLDSGQPIINAIDLAAGSESAASATSIRKASFARNKTGNHTMNAQEGTPQAK